MRIAFITIYLPKPSGRHSSSFVLNQITGLLNKGHDVQVFPVWRRPNNEIENEMQIHDLTGRVHYYNIWVFLRHFLRYIKNLVVLLFHSLKVGEVSLTEFYNNLRLVIFEGLMREKKIEIIHAHYGPNGRNIVPIKKLLNVPVVTYFYGQDVSLLVDNPEYYKRLLQMGDTILVLSEDMARIFIEHGCPREKIRILHLGLDCDMFKFSERAGKDTITFSIIARFVEKKGIEYGIRAFAKVKEQYPNALLRIVGEGPLSENLKGLVESLKVKGVTFVNNFAYPNPGEVVLNEYDLCDVFVLPSVSIKGEYGGTPIVLMEAQASGIPCITTDDAGNSEVVVHNRTGFIVKQRDVDGLAEKMLELIENPELRQRFGKNGREHIEKNFNTKIQIEKLEQIYRELLDKHEGGM